MAEILDTNYLSVNNFQFDVLRLPNVSFFVQKISLPGVSANPAIMQNPFSDIPFAPDNGTYDPLKITFILDAEMNSYVELFRWWQGVVAPETFTSYADLKSKDKTKDGLYSDLTVGILNGTNQMVRSIQYRNAMPVSISSIEFGYDLKDVQYATVDVVFSYQTFDFV